MARPPHRDLPATGPTTPPATAPATSPVAAPATPPPGIGPADRAAAWLRNGWRQLTSMRTALVLLFLLAVAAIPGSVLPQRTVSVEEVARYFQEYPRLAPVLDRLGGFDVYASPWFSAIYLLLFVSLVGCVLPRARDHLRALRRPPVDAPRRLSRLPQHAADLTAAPLAGGPADPAATEPIAAAETIHRRLRGRRWRSVVRRHGDGTVTVSAEKGYLKETGNLLMHAAMVVVLIGVALGASYGWHGNRLVVAGPEHRFCDTLGQFDEFGLGHRVGGEALPPFCFTLNGFTDEYTDDGLPTKFLAHGELTEDGGPPRPVEFTVNSPLRLDGAAVYLLGNGYAPVLRYTDRHGRSQTVTAPFRPVDSMGSAEGVAMFPDANVDPDGNRDPDLQVGFEGLYLPTAPADAPVLLGSVHPAERDPRLLLIPYRGDLGLDDGVPRSVWTLDQQRVADGTLAQAGEPQFIAPGEALTLDDGTAVEFVGTERWITVSVRHDPGHPVLLVGVGALLLGLVLSLTGHRRRVWFRVTPGTAGAAGAGGAADAAGAAGSRVEAGGLPRSDYPGFADEFADLVEPLRSSGPVDRHPVPAGRST